MLGPKTLQQGLFTFWMRNIFILPPSSPPTPWFWYHILFIIYNFLFQFGHTLACAESYQPGKFCIKTTLFSFVGGWLGKGGCLEVTKRTKNKSGSTHRKGILHEGINWLSIGHREQVLRLVQGKCNFQPLWDQLTNRRTRGLIVHREVTLPISNQGLILQKWRIICFSDA